jgi:hypothetical protein
MALWNEKDSRWDNVPDADLTFSDYVTKLLRQPSTFARPAFGGPFASTAQPAPVADQTKMEGMFEEYLRKKQPPSSNAPFGYDSEGNRRTAPETNLTDAEWDAVKQLRDEQGWNNPYDVNSRKAFGQAALGMLGGPIGFAQGAYRAQEPANTAMSYLHNYMFDKSLQDPNSAASQVYGYQIPTSGGVAPVAPVAPEPVAPVPSELPVAQSYPVSSGSYYTPSESYAASIASGWSPTAANYAGGVYAGGTSEGE